MRQQTNTSTPLFSGLFSSITHKRSHTMSFHTSLIFMPVAPKMDNSHKSKTNLCRRKNLVQFATKLPVSKPFHPQSGTPSAI